MAWKTMDVQEQRVRFVVKTVKDVPAQNVKDVSALDTVFAWWGGRLRESAEGRKKTIVWLNADY